MDLHLICVHTTAHKYLIFNKRYTLTRILKKLHSNFNHSQKKHRPYLNEVVDSTDRVDKTTELYKSKEKKGKTQKQFFSLPLGSDKLQNVFTMDP